MSALRSSGKDFLARIMAETTAKVANSLDSWTNPTPPRMLVFAPDLWGGEPEHGRLICNGYFTIGHQQWKPAQGDVWSALDVPPAWRDHVLSFAFLSDLHACGTDASRREARHHIAQFIMRPALRMEAAQHQDVASKRLINWLTHYEFYGTSATYEFQLEVRRSLGLQLRGLMKIESAVGMPSIRQAVAISMGGLCLEGYESAYTLGGVWLDSALRNFVKHIGVATRSTADALETLALLSSLRCTILQAGKVVPECITKASIDLVNCLRFLRGGDKKLPLFHGGRSGNIEAIDKILKRADVRAKPNNNAAMGFQKLALGRTQILLDCGALPSVEHDELAHAAPLALEMWIGRDRLFTQCGNSPFLPEASRMALRGTAAHSTICIDERNVCEVRTEGGLGRRYPSPQFQRWELDGGGVMVEACHAGYQSLFGLTHKRKLALLEDGEYLAGEDEISSDAELLRPHYITVRFHLHPRVQASLIQNDTEVLLRLPNSGGWRFSGDGGLIVMEESVYCGSGYPRGTKCISMTREMTAPIFSIPWAVQAELPS